MLRSDVAAAAPQLHAAARWYASRGWPVLPLRPRDKRPIVPGGDGFENATTDVDVIDRWWRDHPDANVGLRTGRAAGIVVLDVDGDDGADALRALEREHGDLPPTWTGITPRGGAHYYFAAPDVPVKTSAAQLGPGLDLRGEGGLVAAAPSIGANGRRYEVDHRGDLAAMPGWLVALTREPPSGTRAAAATADEWARMVRDGVEDGSRNTSIARLCGYLFRRYVDPDLVLELALLVNRSRFRPPLPDDQVEATVNSIAFNEAQRRRRRKAAA